MYARRWSLLLFFVCLFPILLLGHDWNTIRIDSPIWDFAFGTSITIDDSGKVHVVYDKGSNENDVVLRHGIWEQGVFTVETVDSTGGAGIDNDITIDSSGHIHIIYCLLVDLTSYDTDLYYAYYDGDWHKEALDTIGMFTGYSCNIKVDQNNYPHIATLTGSMSPTYIYFDGINWQSQSIPDIIGTDDMVLDSQDHPIVSDHESSQNCMVTIYDGTEWHPDTVDQVSPCFGNSIALDTLGYPHVAYRYYNGTTNCLKYASFDGANWHTEVVDDNGNTGVDPSIAIDSNNFPHISYYSITEQCLKLASWNGSFWEKEIVDNDGDVGRQSALVLDEDDNPYIIYEDDTNLAVKFAYVEPSIVNERKMRVEVPSGITVYPNPFRERVEIKLQMPEDRGQNSENKNDEPEISLLIFDVTGRKVREFILPAKLEWDGRDDSGRKVRSGVYFLRFEAGDYQATKKLLLVR